MLLQFRVLLSMAPGVFYPVMALSMNADEL
jgi:hypothetical protein